ncbi:MAG: methyl-accepting chemotaxis protein [Nitrospirae bacterium]|nr:methyl-accepting chemotaxis protein [Nitrospirota bacterium]
MFKNMTIKMRLISGFGILTALTLIISLVSIFSLYYIKNDVDSMVNDRWPESVAANNVVDGINVVARALRNAIIANNNDLMQKELERVEKARSEVTEELEKLNKHAETEKQKEMLKKITDSRAAYIEVLKNIISLIKEGKKNEAGSALMSKLRPLQEEYVTNVEDYIVYQGKLVEEAGKGAFSGINKSITITIALFCIVALLAGSVAIWILRSITVPLNKAVEVANKVAEGDLSVNIETQSTNEIGKLSLAVKHMVDKLKDLIANIKSTSDNLASASQELSASAEQMSRGLTEQSGRSSQIATAANEMSQTIVDVAKNSSNIASSATETLKIADDGKEIVGKSVDEVKAIAETVSESAKLISSLGERSKQIGEIVNVIKDIADQTNLLALNAAIEAARAGEQGRGFAVVADEVRKLAERTAKATAEIGEMIGAIQVEMDQAVNSMEEGTKRVETGVQFSAQAGEALRKIVKSVGELQSMVQQIATATEEMSTASEQISTDIETIANVSKETTVSSEQVSEASSDLARLAGNLQGLVAKYKV